MSDSGGGIVDSFTETTTKSWGSRIGESIKARCAAVGVRAEVQPRPQGGTRILLEVPPPLSSTGAWMTDTKPSLIQMGDPSGHHHHHHPHQHHNSLQQQMGAAAAAAAAAANYGMPYPWQYAATMNQGLLT